MKKLYPILFILIFLLTACNSKKNESEVISKSQANATYVYVTKTGECYHTSNCSSLRKSKIKITLTQAVEKYRECHLCYPPVIKD